MNAPDLETIVTHGLCTGCGLCASLAGRDRLDMQVTTYGQIRPRARGKLDAATLEGIQSICPGIRVTGAGRVCENHASRLGADSLTPSRLGDRRSRPFSLCGGRVDDCTRRFLLESGKSIRSCTCVHHPRSRC